MKIMSAATAPTRPMTEMLSFIMLGLLSTSSMAWSPSIIRAPSHHHNIMHQFRKTSAKHSSPRCQTRLSSTKLSTTSSELSTAYDKNLPAALVGEAVRSALRSDRGICFDFSTDRYHQQADVNEVSPPSGNTIDSNSRLVSVVKMRGVGTKPFLNAKFSQSISNTIGGGGVVQQLSPKTKLVRKGRAFETAYLTSKGRTIDRLLVLEFPPSDNNDGDEKITMDDAFLITSPGNSGATLYNELSPLVFPMDKVTLDQCGPSSQTMSSRVITLACSSLKDAQTSFRKNVLKLLMRDESYSQEFGFPEDGACHHYSVSGSSGTSMTDVYVMQHTFLAPEICHGYSLFFHESAENSNTATLGDQIWNNLTDENNNEGPVGMGSLEYDTLRVEAGLPGYGNEMTGDGPKKKKSQKNDTLEKNEEQDEIVKDKYYAKSNPLELHLQSLIDTDKGCYQGQEGIASMLKNKRGCPRQLYQAVFYDSENDFNGDGGGFGLLSIDNKELMDFQRLTKQADALSNDTRQPCAGDDIYVLGSNESINVGKITSVAEPNGTGDAKTVALALAKRPGNILKAIKDAGLDLPRWWDDVEPGDDDGEDSNGNVGQKIASEKGGSGIMQPPPLDPLHNLEIVVGGTYTVGRLISVPSRRFGFKSRGSGSVASLVDYEKQGGVVQVEDGPAYFKYDFEGQAEDADTEITATLPFDEPDSQLSLEVEEGDDGNDDELDDLLAKAEEEAVKAAAEADAAAAEAKRKEEKMNLLKAKAAAAM
eukprot:CAMPEP_0201939182 /NCGR_PEP_ID=MMETSP0903-20130614/42692_1 /ASSEMBLY_ACC=CAM_ASM_000552 /TAXON_ID=420261 /ORGANISM="Thalassiosira antarctica, Strain CCMP982" /LENGTH=760 /DNA_ID=CAMNT_0048480645 /DNA_START=50 /DNA_END=2329 /DNA_ORIENTATION=+